MSTTHTQGPWTVTDDGYAITGANGGTLIVETTKANWESLAAAAAQGSTLAQKHLPEVEANARLIAAAPELLAMLEAIRTAYDNAASHGHAIPSELVRAIGESAAITAKAKGWATA